MTHHKFTYMGITFEVKSILPIDKEELCDIAIKGFNEYKKENYFLYTENQSLIVNYEKEKDKEKLSFKVNPEE